MKFATGRLRLILDSLKPSDFVKSVSKVMTRLDIVLIYSFIQISQSFNLVYLA